jgi:hypothetical protein
VGAAVVGAGALVALALPARRPAPREAGAPVPVAA